MRRRRRELVVACAAAVGPLGARRRAGTRAGEAVGVAPRRLAALHAHGSERRDVPTVEVALKIPAGIDSVVVESIPGWKTQIERTNDRVDVVRFTGSLAPDFFVSFRFIARNPVEEGTLVWAVTQRYAGGETVGWTGPPDSDTPAPRHDRQRVGSGD